MRYTQSFSVIFADFVTPNQIINFNYGLAYLILFLLLVPMVSADVFISEIVYDPNPEWIEIYSDEAIDITSCKLFEGNSNHGIKLHQGDAICIGYCVIADKPIEFLDSITYTGTLFDSVFKYGLKNSGESLALICDDVVMDNVTYTSGKLQLLDSNWVSAEPTPGEGPLPTPVPPPEPEPIDYSNIEINELFPNPAGNDNKFMPGGEWIELFNSGSSVDLDGCYFEDESGKKLHITDATTYSTIIDDYLVVYMNGFSGLLNNNDYEKIKLKDPVGNTIDSVSYADSYEGLSWSFSNNRWIKTGATPGNQNFDFEAEEKSTIKIEEVYLGSDERASFGDIIRVNVDIYKGGTDKYAVYARIPDLSKRTQINLFNKYTNYTVTLPIQIDSNCDEHYSNDDYKLEVFGLDAEDSISIKIEGLNKKLCQYVKSPVTETAQKKFEYEILEIPSNVKSGEQFSVDVLLKNNYNKDLSIKIWSYVYLGSKSYSGERDSNMKEFVLPAGGEKVVELSNVFEGKGGQYKHKVQINKDNQKTNQQLVSKINAVAELKCPICSCSGNKVAPSEMVMAGYEPVVYESVSETQEKIAPVMLSLVGLLSFGLLRF